MSAGYSGPQVHIAGDGHTVKVAFEIRNLSTETWRAAEGFAIGYHIFDPLTDTLLVDGERTICEDIAPGASAPVKLEFELPPEPGRYRVFISPMREEVCWYYERGWRFLLLDCVVEEGRASLKPPRVATVQSLRAENFVRSLGRAFVYPVESLWSNRSLLRIMVRRDILGRYRGSLAGAFWAVLNPLLLMLTYFFVFGEVLHTRFGSDPSRAGFALYFLAGMLPWLAFSEALGRAPLVLIEHRNFIRKLVFPVETLPVILVISGLVTEVFAISLFSIGLLATRGAIPASIVWLPLLIVPQLLLTAGLCWFLAALGVFIRDLGQVIGFALTLWFFLTPICYPEASLPPEALPVLSKSPIFVLVRGYRAVFLEGQAPAPGSLWKLWLLAFVVFIAGHAFFYKFRKSFADVI